MTIRITPNAAGTYVFLSDAATFTEIEGCRIIKVLADGTVQSFRLVDAIPGAQDEPHERTIEILTSHYEDAVDSTFNRDNEIPVGRDIQEAV